MPEGSGDKIWRIGIIGGGPAGALFAHFAHRWANRLDKSIKLTIFDGKSFQKSGPQGCNLCAGVISRSFQRLLQEEGIFLPAQRIMSWVDGYVLHVGEEQVHLGSPPGREGKVATVFRGNGPRHSRFPEIISFDDFLLSWAQDLGTQVIPYAVQNVHFPEKEEYPIRIQYGFPDKIVDEEEVDWVIGAFGVNSGLGLKIHRLKIGYTPPRTRLTFQAEMRFPSSFREEFLGNKIHIFIPRHDRIRYATLIPKGEFTTLTIIGWGDVSPLIVKEFFQLEAIKKILPSTQPTCFCYPRIVIGPGQWPKSSRFLVVGDAAFCRYYKNGLESAFFSAKMAAEALFNPKINRKPNQAYYKEAKSKIIKDNFYGRLLFRINDFITSFPFLTKFHISLLHRPPGDFLAAMARTILWDMFTGEKPYREIFRSCFRLRLQGALWRAFFGFVRLKRKNRQQEKAQSYFKPKPTDEKAKPFIKVDEKATLNGKTIVVIGGGPAGTAFAIKLIHLARQRNHKLRIVLYEGKPLEKKSHYNQCLGVLSPPLPQLLEKEVGIPFPWNIIQKTILGYYLHTEKTTIRLEGAHEPSFACRRVEFDSYLFQKARSEGIEIINARVTDLDLLPDGVMVYSESNNLRADLIVGAFGLDDGMTKIMERLTPYRQPDFLFSIVTKFHPGIEAVNKFGQYLHAFLLSSLPRVEFAAITPKGNHLSLNVAGRKVDASSMEAFLQLPAVRKVLPPGSDKALMNLSFYKGKFPTGPAKHYLQPRIIMIGDAAGLNRPFKGKGINSAILTAVRAAEALVDFGISDQMHRHFIGSCADLLGDIPYGRRLRWLTIILTRLGLMDSLLAMSQNEPRLYRALFNIVSGQKTYRSIWEEEKSLRLLLRLATSFLFRRV